MGNHLPNKLPFNIFFAGSYNQNQVEIIWQPADRSLPQSLKNNIDTFWNKEVIQTTKKSFVFNGELCRLDHWEIFENKLILHLGITNYKELLYSNNVTQQIIMEFGRGNLSRALGISIVLVGCDEQIVLIKRSDEVGESPGMLDVVGGHVHPVEHSVSGVPDPFFAIKAEIKEEINLRIKDNEIIDCIGIVETQNTKKPELIFKIKSQYTSDKIVGWGMDNNSSEIASLFTIPNKKDAVSTFLRNKIDYLSPSAVGTLWLYTQSIK